SLTQRGPCAVNIQGGKSFTLWVAAHLYAPFTVGQLSCPWFRKVNTHCHSLMFSSSFSTVVSFFILLHNS
uniref:Uncharacterized protein n=2 Tax=Xiphophorus TaxID=8082 RepID=A0A3B5R6W2_XIPMA